MQKTANPPYVCPQASAILANLTSKRMSRQRFFRYRTRFMTAGTPWCPARVIENRDVIGHQHIDAHRDRFFFGRRQDLATNKDDESARF